MIDIDVANIKMLIPNKVFLVLSLISIVELNMRCKSAGISREQTRNGSVRQFVLETGTLSIGNMAITHSWISK